MCCKRKGVKQRERHFHEYAAIQQQFLRNSHTAYVPHIKVLHIIMMEMKLEGDFVQVGLDRYVKKTPGKKLPIWTTLSIKTEQYILYQEGEMQLTLSRN